MNRYCGQVSAKIFKPSPRACRITCAPSAVETWKIMIGWSTSAAQAISRWNASGSHTRGCEIEWNFGAV